MYDLYLLLSAYTNDILVLRCEHYVYGDRTQYHFILRNLHGYDLSYLEALINDDRPVIDKYENAAKALGYGPRMACSYQPDGVQRHSFCSKFDLPLQTLVD